MPHALKFKLEGTEGILGYNGSLASCIDEEHRALSIHFAVDQNHGLSLAKRDAHDFLPQCPTPWAEQREREHCHRQKFYLPLGNDRHSRKLVAGVHHFLCDSKPRRPYLFAKVPTIPAKSAAAHLEMGPWRRIVDLAG